VDPDAVEDAILDEVRSIRDTPLSAGELERARKQARAQFAYSAESVTNQGFWYGFAESIADQTWLSTHLERLNAVTADDVARVAARWLADDRLTVGRYVPRTAR
jgi:zinc protease